MLHDQQFGMPIVSAKGGGYGSGFVQDIMACTHDPDELVSKQALCRLFECSGRTVQRMVARRDLPPPLTVAGRKYWQAGTLGKWLAAAARWKQAEIEAEARKVQAIMAERWRN